MHTVENGTGRKYRVRWREGGRLRSRSFDRKREADDFDAEQRRRRQRGGVIPGQNRTLVADYAERWLREKRREVTRATIENYAVQFELRVGPMLGGFTLHELSPRVLRDFIQRLQEAGTPPPTIQKTCTALGAMLQRATEDGLVEANAMRSVRKPSAPRSRTPDVISPATVENIRTHLQLRDATLVSVLAYAGLRPESEAVTLRWTQVGDRALDVHASKTGRARQVRVLTPLAEDLAAWRKQSRGNGLVFPHGPGGWSRDDWRNWLRRTYRPAAVAAGLPADTRPRDLRGSFASLLIAGGLNVVEVAEQLGHSPSMCLDTYARAFADYDPAQREDPETVIRRARGC